MNKTIYESCVNCANINICSGPDYIDGSCDPGFKPKDQQEQYNEEGFLPISDSVFNVLQK